MSEEFRKRIAGKNIVFSFHAERLRALQRGIEREIIEFYAKKPEKVFRLGNNKFRLESWVGEKILVIILEESEKVLKIITVYWWEK